MTIDTQKKKTPTHRREEADISVGAEMALLQESLGGEQGFPPRGDDSPAPFCCPAGRSPARG